MLPRWLTSRLAGLATAIPLLLPVQAQALSGRPSDPLPPAAAGPAAVEPVDLPPPTFGTPASIALARAELHARLPDVAPPAPAAAADDGEDAGDAASGRALKLTIVYGAVSIGLFTASAVFIPVGGSYFFSAVRAKEQGLDPGFQPPMPLFFIGIGLLVPAVICLSKGLDQLRLYKQLTATAPAGFGGPSFAGLSEAPRDKVLAGDLVLVRF